MKPRRRILAATVAVVTLFCVISPALAETTPTAKGKEEVVYIMTDGSGSVESVNIVSILSGPGSVTDYGDYTAVKMLTTDDAVSLQGDEISFTTDAEKVYYQGTMRATQIPWNISIRYFLDGTEYAPEALSGKSGKLKIQFCVTQGDANMRAFYEDYALQAAFTLDGTKCANIKSDGATIANVGADKQLTYTLLPGEGVDTEITADVTDFSMQSVSINGVRLHLDVEVDDAELMDDIRELINAMVELDDASVSLRRGAKKLKDGSSDLSDGAAKINAGVAKLQAGAYDLEGGVAKVQDTLEKLDAKSPGLVQNSAALLAVLTDMQTQLAAISISASDMQALLTASASIKSGIGGLESRLDYDFYKNAMLEAQAYNGAFPSIDVDGVKRGNQTSADELQAFLDAHPALTDAEKAPLLTAIARLKANNSLIGKTEAYIGERHAEASGLKTAYNGLDTKLTELATNLTGLAGDLTTLKTSVNQLVVLDTAFDQGVQEYAGVVSALNTGFDQIVTGVLDLSRGAQMLGTASEPLAKGASELYDSLVALYNGTGKLADGTGEAREETDGMDVTAQDKIDEMLAKVQGNDTQPVSFASGKNKDVASVQFVIKTAEIPEYEAPEETVPEEAEPGFWQKLIDLF